MNKRPNILAIGGFDPSAGAGVLADIKTIEMIGGYGFACNTANTIQSDSAFHSVNWVEEAVFLAQMDEIERNYEVDFIKVGLLNDFRTLLDIRHCFPTATVVWDPILSASAGFDFGQENEWDMYISVVDIVTPNYDELKFFAGDEDVIDFAKETSNLVTIVLKGGHHPTDKGKDVIYDGGEEVASFESKVNEFKDKHGTGCIFSSALTTYLALGKELPEAVELAKDYVTSRANSNDSKLAYHKL